MRTSVGVWGAVPGAGPGRGPGVATPGRLGGSPLPPLPFPYRIVCKSEATELCAGVWAPAPRGHRPGGQAGRWRWLCRLRGGCDVSSRGPGRRSDAAIAVTKHRATLCFLHWAATAHQHAGGGGRGPARGWAHGEPIAAAMRGGGWEERCFVGEGRRREDSRCGLGKGVVVYGEEETTPPFLREHNG